MKIHFLLIIILLSNLNTSFAQEVEVPEFGKKKADTYFIERQKRSVKNTVIVPDEPYAQQVPQQQYQKEPSSYNPNSNYQPNNNYGSNYLPHIMAIQVGYFLNDKAHRWGNRSNNEDVGQWNLGVTYLLGEWINSMDLYFRGDLQGFKVDDESANKMSLSGLVTFPDIRSGFPIYFGAGAGLGIFFDQVDDESSLSFDYQILIGGRILNLYKGIGFVAEAGAKNHIFLTSKGQFNGYFLSLGSIFNF